LPAVNTRGNLGRNSLTGPGLVNADLALVKSFDVGSLHALQLRIEGFKRVQPCELRRASGRIAFTASDAQGKPDHRTHVGRITSTVHTARQIQLGLKYMF